VSVRNEVFIYALPDFYTNRYIDFTFLPAHMPPVRQAGCTLTCPSGQAGFVIFPVPFRGYYKISSLEHKTCLPAGRAVILGC